MPKKDLNISDNAKTILGKRYLDPDETPYERYYNMAEKMASAEPTKKMQEKYAQRYFQLFEEQKVLPNSPAIMNYGKPKRQAQGSACFVLHVEDDLNNIFDTIRRAALIHKSGGGTGYNFSSLRPNGGIVSTTGKPSGGVIPFLKAYDAATGAVSQGGTRRGANMGILNCLDGATKIHTLDGKIPIKDLVGKNPYVYACDPLTKTVHIIQAEKVFVSDTNRQLVRVWFDNDEYVDCTPDHKFLLSNGEYVEAEKLNIGTSLMAFSKKIIKGGSDKNRYLKQIKCTGGNLRLEHHIVAEDVLNHEVNPKWHIHHKDLNPLNNDPNNLEILSMSDHAYVHAYNFAKYREDIAGNRRGKTYEEIYGEEKATEIKTKMSKVKRTPWNKGLIGEKYKEHYQDGFKNQFDNISNKTDNHKVIKVEQINVAENVYDITVPIYHNFVANEVFVHNCNHPDIFEFITCKSDENQIKNFNLSIGVTEEFFKAVTEDADWELYFNDQNGNRIQFYPNGDQTQPLVTEIVVKARELYQLIVEHAHKNGEPGLVFVDRLQRGNSVPLYVIEATNPCGEQPLPPENSCVLASENLANHMKEDWSDIDWDKLDKTTETTVRMLDDIVTVNEYPIEEIKIEHDKQRRIGLGITGLADVLIMMGIPYGSSEGRKKAAQIMKFLNDRSHYYSYLLGKEKGNFELFSESKFNLNGQYREEAIEFYRSFLPEDEFNELLASDSDGYMRNAATTTIAPTGTLTSLLGAEGYGCEPLFAIGYMRHILNGEVLPYVSLLFEMVAKQEGFYSEALIEKAAKSGTAQIDEVPMKWREVFKCANEILVDDHILMQSALQKHCDSGISKTINMSSEATIDDVNAAYQLAYRTGNIKGITVYRDKSRGEAPISIGTETKEEKESSESELTIDQVKEIRKTIELEVSKRFENIKPIPRPKLTHGPTGQYNTGCGKMFLSVNHDENDKIIETFAITGSAGGCQGLTEGMSRMISYTIRLAQSFAEKLDIDQDKIMDSVVAGIVDQLKSVKCNTALRNKKSEGKSCPDIMGRALEKEYANLKTISKAQTKRRETDVLVEEISHMNDDCESGGCTNCSNRAACQGDILGEIGIDEQNQNILELSLSHDPCPECGEMLLPNEGCKICPNCGYSKCN